MSDEEIRKIAVDVADRMYRQFGDQSSVDMMADEIADMLNVISERYCIVEKSKVLEEYARTFPDDYDRDLSSISCDCMLHRLFGKDTFNESTNHYNTD